MTLALALVVLVPALQDDILPAGREHWEKPWVPDLGKDGARVEIPAGNRIDVVLLGDGYLAQERAQFEKDVRDWYERFLTYTPWSQFRGAFRVQGLWTPSEGRATPERKSHYRLPASSAGVGDVSSEDTRKAVFAALDRVAANPAAARGRLTHAVAVLLVRNEQGRNPSGMSRGVTSPDGKRSVSVAFAAYTHHEFGHAYAGLRDEYIRGEGSRSNARAPERPSLHTLTNLTYTKDPRQVPWAHLMPGSAANPDRESVIGVLWLGGISEEGAWHSEARCLMNGTHENWDLAKSRRGANLRDMARFCFWCEELAVARTLQKTGRLGPSEDGEALWKKWAEELRPLYHQAFDVPGRIRAKNAENAKAKLAEAKIYERPGAP